jgi:hypothetical protein
VVRSRIPRPQSLSPVRPIESRVDAGDARLSVSARTVDCHQDTGLGLVRRLRALRRRHSGADGATRASSRCRRPGERPGRRVGHGPPGNLRQVLWCALAATSSALLLP